MRHFLIFIILIFSGLAVLHYNTEDKTKQNEDRIVHVYASTSFVAKWGPAPLLKEAFEKQNLYKVEFIEMPDVGMALQKISFENQNSIADIILGLDQYDISKATAKIKWRTVPKELINSTQSQIIKDSEIIQQQNRFIPYDWSPMSFVTKKEYNLAIETLDDLLKPEFKGKIALQDPRTSTPGLRFLAWVFETKSEVEAVVFLKKLMKQVHSFSSGWSTSYGLFKNKQVDMVFSYVTSPLYHLIEENDSSYMSLEFKESLPVQIEFAGIPETCKNCEGAEKFVAFLLSKDAQKIIMEKNYMLPILDIAKEASAFDALKIYKTTPMEYPEQEKIDKWINQWIEIRKNEGL